MLPAETQRNITEQHGLHTNLSKLIIIQERFNMELVVSVIR